MRVVGESCVQMGARRLRGVADLRGSGSAKGQYCITHYGTYDLAAEHAT